MACQEPKPRGIRNHNPGNIRRGRDQWQGASENQSDSKFVQFENALWGIRALARVLLTYESSYGLRTVRSILTRWAPPEENDTEAYIADVAMRTGFDPDQRISAGCFPELKPLVEAIIQHENGEQPYSDEQIEMGLAMAGVRLPTRLEEKDKTA